MRRRWMILAAGIFAAMAAGTSSGCGDLHLHVHIHKDGRETEKTIKADDAQTGGEILDELIGGTP